jgi:hypothetical protein
MSRIPADDERARVNNMVHAIIRAILDETPWMPGATEEVIGNFTKFEGERLVKMDEPLVARYVIATIGVQTKVVENPTATKAFVHQMADLIEDNINNLRGDETPFAPHSGMFRDDQRH